MSNIINREMTEAEAKAYIAKRDRQSWYPGTHAHNAYAVNSGRDGREVCRCASRADRDLILTLARKE